MTSSPASFDNPLDVHIEQRLGKIRELVVSCGRSLDDVRIVAVTKSFGADVVAAALRCGLTDLGENYLDELVKKRTSNTEAATWHYLGALQSRKIPEIAQHADVIESLSRRREVEILSRQSRQPPVYIQVDFTGEAARNGARPDELDDLIGAARDAGLQLRGLMTVAPRDKERAHEAFSLLVRAADRYQLEERSMGMSDDLEIALRAGSSEIRLGRSLFGDRFAARGASGLT